MNEPNQEEEQQDPRRGPNLVLIYSLIVLAMLAAIAVAAFIVLPFYNRR
jgi:hypothetical protein